MSEIYEDRDDERDWNAENPPKLASDEPPQPESVDDATRPATRHHTHRRPPQRRGSAYRPPSELDRD